MTYNWALLAGKHNGTTAFSQSSQSFFFFFYRENTLKVIFTMILYSHTASWPRSFHRGSAARHTSQSVV